MAANKTIGGINVTITATTDKFAKGITQCRKLTTSFGSSVKGLVFNLKTLGAALAVGGITKMVANQYTAIDALEELSQKTGVTTDKLAGLQLAARNAGVDNALLERSLVKLNNAFGMTGDKALEKWIVDTSKLTTQQEKLTAATEMFGAKGSSMVRFLNGGVGALKEAQKAAEMTGMAITQVEATAVASLMQSFDDLKDRAIGTFRQMAVASAPYVSAITGGINNAIDAAGGGKGIGKFIADVLVEMAKNVVDIVQAMGDSGAMAFYAMQQMVVGFRSSAVGKAMGVGYGSGLAEARAQGGLDRSYKETKEFINRPRWSKGIDKLASDAMAAAAKAIEDNSTKDLMAKALGWADTGRNAFNFAKDKGPGLLGQFSQLKSNGLGNLVEGFFGLGGPGNKLAAMAGSQRPSLAFAESGSVESYRQQAAIRRQSENIAKSQLGVQKEMLAELRAQGRNAIVLEPANLGRG